MISNTQPVYRCRDLVKRRQAEGSDFELHVPSLRIHAGEVVILRGASGCGKSTVLDLLAMALRPDAVDQFYFCPGDGVSVDVKRCRAGDALDALGRQRGEHIGYILQTGGLLPFLTVRENIAASCRLLGLDPVRPVERLAKQLDIQRQLDKHPNQLSLGERQRVAIARAMAHGPRVILADEPTASLDPLNAIVIRDLLLDLVRQSGIAAVIATHDWDLDAIPGARVLQHRLERVGRLVRSSFSG